jgi:hypothetical protein
MEKLDPKAVWLFFFRFLGIGLILILILGWFFAAIVKEVVGFGLGWWILIIVAIWLLGSYGWAKLSYNAYKFELTEDVFKKESGVIWKKYVSIPYERIQNVDIQRGIVARILGLSDLMIQTAGYAGVYRGILGGWGRDPEGRLPGLSKERAEEIREELLRKAKGTKSGL